MNEYNYLSKVSEKLDAENYHDVIALCNNALQINENTPDAYYFRGKANFWLERYDDSLEDFSKAVELDPKNAEYYYWKSWSYKWLDNLGEAIANISKAMYFKAEESLYYYDKGRFEYWDERYKEAIEDFSKGIELKPTTNKYTFRGMCYSALDMYDLAYLDMNKAVELDEESLFAIYQRGLLKKKTGCLEEAISDFKRGIEISSKDDDCMLEIGFIKIELGKKDAMKYFNKAIKANESADNYIQRVIARRKILKRENILNQLSRNRLLKNNFDEDEIFNDKQAKDDIRDLNKAIDLDYENMEAVSLRANRYNYLKKYSKLVDDCTTLIENDSEEYKKYYLIRANANNQMGLYSKAIEDCNSYIDSGIDDKYSDALFIKAVAEYKMGEYQQAVTDFNKAISIKDIDAQSYYYRGLANYKLKHYIKAANDIKNAIKLKADIETVVDNKMPGTIKLFIKFTRKNETPISLNQCIKSAESYK